MIYRPLGRTGLTVSAIGLGCQSLGGGLYHRDDAETLRLVRRAVELGVTFFDTADHYSQGRSESMLGQALAGRHDGVVIATKIGTSFPSGTRAALAMRDFVRPVGTALRPLRTLLQRYRFRQGRSDFTPEAIVRAVEASLQRLQVEAIDLLQFHKPDARAMREGTLCQTAARLQAEGKIRHYGVACVDLDDALVAMEQPGVAAIQVAINCLEPTGLDRLTRAAATRGIAVIGRNPRAIGLLTDAHEETMGDASAYGPHHAARLAAARSLRGLIRPDRTLAQAAIRYAVELPGIASVLPRAVATAELEANLASLDVPPLTPADQALIARAQAMTASLAGPIRQGRPAIMEASSA
jgi:aryl-alcohol dehydrogenase-like predicted oxidoreductase